jgi:hypothetical protein
LQDSNFSARIFVLSIAALVLRLHYQTAWELLRNSRAQRQNFLGRRFRLYVSKWARC